MVGEDEPKPEVLFPERLPKENSRKYWQRAIKKNLERGVPHSLIAEVFGDLMGDKEEREGIDGMTGLKKKEVFWEDLKEILGHIYRQVREGISEKASLILVDLDDFKRMNDTRGYRWGDKTLVEIAEVLKKNRRAEDVVARYGGEEFCLILVGCPEQEAIRIAEDLRASIEKVGVTASIGIAVTTQEQETPEDFFDRANVTCAIAKGSLKHSSVVGTPKNRAVLWQPEMPLKLENKNG